MAWKGAAFGGACFRYIGRMVDLKLPVPVTDEGDVDAGSWLNHDPASPHRHQQIPAAQRRISLDRRDGVQPVGWSRKTDLQR